MTISLDGFETTEFLEFNPDGYVWENDWWEGEKDVKLLGFMPVDNIHVYGFPPADVKPVVKGHWIHLSRTDRCSECGWEAGRYESVANFCPWCGADLREES